MERGPTQGLERNVREGLSAYCELNR